MYSLGKRRKEWLTIRMTSVAVLSSGCYEYSYYLTITLTHHFILLCVEYDKPYRHTVVKLVIMLLVDKRRLKSTNKPSIYLPLNSQTDPMFLMCALCYCQWNYNLKLVSSLIRKIKWKCHCIKRFLQNQSSQAFIYRLQIKTWWFRFTAVNS